MDDEYDDEEEIEAEIGFREPGKLLFYVYVNRILILRIIMFFFVKNK